jgi:hypothetical protein
MVIYVQQGGTRRRRFNIYKWVELVVDWEFAWSLQQQVLGGSADGFFPRSQAVSGMARLCGAASGRQSEGGLRAAGCWLLAAGSSLVVLVVWQQQNFWLAWLAGGGGQVERI